MGHQIVYPKSAVSLWCSTVGYPCCSYQSADWLRKFYVKRRLSPKWTISYYCTRC